MRSQSCKETSPKSAFIIQWRVFSFRYRMKTGDGESSPPFQGQVIGNGNCPHRGRPKLDQLLPIQPEDPGEQVPAHHMVFSTDVLQCGDESFRTQRREKWEFCGIIFLTKVILEHQHIHWLMDDFSPRPPPLTGGQGFYYCFPESQNDTYHFSFHSQSIIEIHTVFVCALASLAMNVMAHFPPCKAHLHCGSEQKVRQAARESWSM